MAIRSSASDAGDPGATGPQYRATGNGVGNKFVEGGKPSHVAHRPDISVRIAPGA